MTLKLIKMIYFSIPPTILPTKLSEPDFAVVCSGPFDDVLKIDGNMAIAWSSSLQFTTENASKE